MKRSVTALAVFALVLVAIFLLDPALNAWVQDVVNSFGAPVEISDQKTQSALYAINLKDEVSQLGILTPGVVLRVGQPVPDFALRDINGRVVKLSDFKDQRSIVLNFWASWCEPCKREMPDLERIYQKYSDQLVVIGVDMQEPIEAVFDFLSRHVRVSYPVLLDGAGVVAKGFNVFAQPTTFFINKEGLLMGVGNMPAKFGAFTSEELDMLIGQFLGLSKL